MTARTISEEEGTPATWPALALTVPPYLDPEFDRDISDEMVWRRIETWITRRWPSRSVTYVAEGPGSWRARLEPFTVTTKEVWRSGAWEACTLDPTPLGGLELPGEGPYRIAGTAGDDTAVPADFTEAASRLYMYFRGIGMTAWSGAATYRTETSQAPAAWAAKAIHLSGAADMLRPYRRLGVE